MRFEYRAVLFDLFGTLIEESGEPIPGAHACLTRLSGFPWAIVTSLGARSAPVLIRGAGLPEPPLLITADDVVRNKPAPDGYRLAARRLSIEPADALVVEDSLMGITAGRAAGMDVVAVLRGRSRDFAHSATFALKDLAALQLSVEGAQAILEIEGLDP
jgi:mannitol-1-/sugar-/sorbitol-6-phosphatase